jgi:hypothetical protein
VATAYEFRRLVGSNCSESRIQLKGIGQVNQECLVYYITKFCLCLPRRISRSIAQDILDLLDLCLTQRNATQRNTTQHKVSCIKTLFNRIDTHCNTDQSKQDERKYLLINKVLQHKQQTNTDRLKVAPYSC